MRIMRTYCNFFLEKTADLVTFNEEILNGKLQILCSEICDLGFHK